jgi:hypothetical protein
VIKAEGYAIEELSSIYPYRKTWYWNGKQWILVRPSLFGQYWLLVLAISGIFLLITLGILFVNYLMNNAPYVLGWLMVIIFAMLTASFLLGRRR